MLPPSKATQDSRYSSMLKIGTVIDEKFEVLALLGEGGMSRVYLARDKRLNKQWAIKEIKQTGDRVKDEASANSVITEANTLKRIDHPLLPRIVDVLSYNGSVLVVMDYIEGQSLATILADFGAQGQADVVEWGLELCGALDYLHNLVPPIIYRDMKPANIMVKPDGTIRIIDFGTARELRTVHDDANIGDTTVLGTRGYAAPEQFGGAGQTDVRTDIYCLGATLYHLLTGKSPAEPPYEMVPIRQVNPALSPGLETVITKCTQPNPALRYQSCAELFFALENFERLDSAYFKKQKLKLAGFITAAALAVIFLLSGIGMVVANNVIINRMVAEYLSIARVSSDPAASETSYITAIDLKPSNLSAYEDLIDSYKSDNLFTTAEESGFQNVIATHMKYIRTDSAQAANLNYEIGMLYLYYFSYDGVRPASMVENAKYAWPWFEFASTHDFEYQDSARLYYTICVDSSNVFDMEAAQKLRPEDYEKIFHDLQSLQSLSESQNSVVRLSVAELTLTIFDGCKYKIPEDSVPIKERFDLCEQARKVLEETSPPNEEFMVSITDAKMVYVKLQPYFEQYGYFGNYGSSQE